MKYLYFALLLLQTLLLSAAPIPGFFDALAAGQAGGKPGASTATGAIGADAKPGKGAGATGAKGSGAATGGTATGATSAKGSGAATGGTATGGTAAKGSGAATGGTATGGLAAKGSGAATGGTATGATPAKGTGATAGGAGTGATGANSTGGTTAGATDAKTAKIQAAMTAYAADVKMVSAFLDGGATSDDPSTVASTASAAEADEIKQLSVLCPNAGAGDSCKFLQSGTQPIVDMLADVAKTADSPNKFASKASVRTTTNQINEVR